jgi:quinol monooxygenase YgiN
MTVVLLVDVHGLSGRAEELRHVLSELRAAARTTDGNEGFTAAESIGESAEFVLSSCWRDEAAMRGHFASPAYARYNDAVTPLLARPSDVTIHYAERTVHPVGDPSREAARQG